MKRAFIGPERKTHLRNSAVVIALYNDQPLGAVWLGGVCIFLHTVGLLRELGPFEKLMILVLLVMRVGHRFVRL